MKLPTLRQASGFVMLVNTFLPAIVVLTLGLMIWSTITVVRHQGCATVGYIAAAFGDSETQKAYLAANNDEAKQLLLDNLVKTLKQPVPTDNTPKQPAATDPRPCEEMGLRQIIDDELYQKTVDGIRQDVRKVGTRVAGVKKDLIGRIPTMDAWTLASVPVPKTWPLKGIANGVNTAIGAVNSVPTTIRAGLVTLGNAVGGTVQWLVAPLGVADYKRAAAWALLSSLLTDTTELFGKFYWFFVGLALWLVFSYVLWAYRRLSVGWALLCNREAI